MNKIFYISGLFSLFYLPLSAVEKAREEILKEESESVLERSLKIAAQFYSLEEGTLAEDLKEITDVIL